MCDSQDSWRHSLIDCTTSRCTWALVDEDLAQSIVATAEPSAKQWLFALMETLSHEQFVTSVVTLWAIWTSRRKAIHEGIFQSPAGTNSFVKRYILELQSIEQQPPARGLPSTRVPRPRAPPIGHAKIHVDVAVRKGRGGSAPAVCWDGQGNYMGSSALVIGGLEDPVILETIAFRVALALADDLNITNVIIATDSKQTVADIKKGAKGRNSSIVHEISLITSLFHCNFSFERRAATNEAHKLAKYSLAFDPGRHIWLGQPHDPHCFLSWSLMNKVGLTLKKN
ncbi:hypothetical protein ZWY2020_038373 [Hordeum vulgare]|nr:hypothetical protein ZWY2020_038373 [Hordeum vulgare]